MRRIRGSHDQLPFHLTSSRSLSCYLIILLAADSAHDGSVHVFDGRHNLLRLGQRG